MEYTTVAIEVTDHAAFKKIAEKRRTAMAGLLHQWIKGGCVLLETPPASPEASPVVVGVDSEKQ